MSQQNIILWVFPSPTISSEEFLPRELAPILNPLSILNLIHMLNAILVICPFSYLFSFIFCRSYQRKNF